MSSAPRAFVIGHPIKHSRSPLIHGYWLQRFGLAGSYERIAVAPAELIGFIARMRETGFVGGNVTVPHKEAVMMLADDVDDAARAVGAANTLWFEGDRLMAGNTDVLGFLASLDAEAPGWDAGPGRAVVLGAGGAARGVVFGLLQRGFAVEVVNRSGDKAEALRSDFGPRVTVCAPRKLVERLSDAELLVNTTSLGMEGQPRLDFDVRPLWRRALVCDIVYSPLETELLRNARLEGLRTVGGLGMLLHQAVPGFERWFGVRPEVTPALRAIIEADIRS